LWIISGVVAGWLTGQMMRGRGYGLIGDLVIGLLGGMVGGWLFGALELAARNTVGEIVMAFVGGAVLVALVRIRRRA
jgi:uncharacterized membrane protein YeaQ/YmgE (transglycosylase-associated protein family)